MRASSFMASRADAEIATIDTQVGTLSVAATPIGVLAVAWATPERLSDTLGVPLDSRRSGGELVEPALTQLGEYFAGARRDFELPLDWRLVTGRSARAVLQTLHDTVGFGHSISYGELAVRGGSGVPARGVGAIMGANPLPIVVPCHRVVGASGLGGFSGGDRSGELEPPVRPGSSPYGLQTKHWLLTFEGVFPPMLGWDPAARLDLDGRSQISGGHHRGVTA